MRHDVIVLGGGPAGTTAAICLARQGRSVALLEKASFPRRKVCGEFMSATSVPVLRMLGVEDAWDGRAGPEVRRVALFAGSRAIEAAMPARHGFGRALGRDVLDMLLRDEARRLGVDLRQPCRAIGLTRDGDATTVTVDAERLGTLRAPVIVAAHGSWERGRLATERPKSASPSDMFGFKAHFRDATLAPDVMPLLAFPGGYGGIVWADDGRLSLSCCIRRDALERLRQRQPGSAAEAVFAHVMASCLGVRRALADATLSGGWLAAGPIRPGIRPRYADDVFRVGNLAGEAHPVIAEGISMAIQSGALLAEALRDVDVGSATARAAAGRRYGRRWLRHFGPRIQAARAIAALAMRPELLGRTIDLVPSLLTVGATLSGKAHLSLPGDTVRS